jgi:phospholipase C
VFILTHDEWGGFFDHVPPPRAAAANDVDPDIEGGKTLLGFRIPTIIASPFSRGHADDPCVKHDVCDHTSTLKLIEWRFGLAPLTPRDASSDVANLASFLDFRHPRTSLPELPSPVDPGRTLPAGHGEGAPTSTRATPSGRSPSRASSRGGVRSADETAGPRPLSGDGLPEHSVSFRP